LAARRAELDTRLALDYEVAQEALVRLSERLVRVIILRDDRGSSAALLWR